MKTHSPEAVDPQLGMFLPHPTLITYDTKNIELKIANTLGVFESFDKKGSRQLSLNILIFFAYFAKQ